MGYLDYHDLNKAAMLWFVLNVPNTRGSLYRVVLRATFQNVFCPGQRGAPSHPVSIPYTEHDETSYQPHMWQGKRGGRRL
jgi:hypothetical protein